MSPIRGVALAGMLVLTSAVPARAHTTSTALATLTVDGAVVTVRLMLMPAELPEHLRAPFTVAAGGDREAAARVVDPLRGRIVVRADGASCSPGRATVQGSSLGDGRLTVTLTYRCAHAPGRLTLRDDSFDLFGEHHRTLARIEIPSGSTDAALSFESREVSAGDAGGSSTPLGFVRLGVDHILTGWDHLLFLAALLLGGGGAVALLKIVTAFTLAHSVSLAAPVLHVVELPSRIVESAIAASIAWVAVENLVRRGRPRRRWVTSFVFGLVHGLGFASALTPLALPPARLAVALVGFNVGVEAGQAAALALALPAMAWLRGRPAEGPVLRAASIVVAAVGVLWFVVRLLR